MIRFVFGAAVGLVVAALVAAILMVGGPGEGRAEAQDRERSREMRRLVREISWCNRGSAALPDTLEQATGCGNSLNATDLTDPETGDAYHYERLDDSRFEVCVRYTSRLYTSKNNQRGAGYEKGDLFCHAGSV